MKKCIHNSVALESALNCRNFILISLSDKSDLQGMLLLLCSTCSIMPVFLSSHSCKEEVASTYQGREKGTKTHYLGWRLPRVISNEIMQPRKGILRHESISQRKKSRTLAGYLLLRKSKNRMNGSFSWGEGYLWPRTKEVVHAAKK